MKLRPPLKTVANRLNATDRKSLGSFPRSPGNGRKACAPTAVADYAPGHFTALIAKHDWPPNFIPQFEHELHWSDARRVQQIREHQTANAVGWGSGTLPMTKTPKHARPTAMGKGGAR